MAQYITLDEAALRLGIPADDFKRRLKTEWTHVVPMRDGPTLRFRANQIDELARQLGAASDPGLNLAPLDADQLGSDDFKVPAGPKTGKLPRPGAKPADEPLAFDSDDDIFSLTSTGEEALPPPPPPKKGPAGKRDSDIRLEPPRSSSSDSSQAIPTEEISLDLGGGGASSAVIKGGSSAKLPPSKSSARLNKPDSGKKLASGDSGRKLSSDSGRNLGNMGDSSEFELSLDADSDDFELQLNTDSSDEVDLGSSPVEDRSNKSGKSGVNLRNPGDSGISLEKGRKKGDTSGRNLAGNSGRNLGGNSGRNLAGKAASDSDSEVDFELSLEEGSGASSHRIAGPKSTPRMPVTSDSDSEFELTLDDSGSGSSLDVEALQGEDESKGDIFETDFEIPPMSDESGSEAVALESDTDLEDRSSEDVALDDSDVVVEDETGSQVVVLEDEPDEAATGVTRRRPASDEDVAVEEEEESVGSALAGVRGRRRDADEDEDEAAPTVAGGVAPAAPWGPVPAIILFPAFLLLIFGGLMGYELVHTMTGYQQPRKPTAPLVRWVAKTLDMELKDQ